jgi:predicted RNA binding protein YcfA (HicA-like mRNA interferase family)
MPKLPIIKPNELVRFLLKIGFRELRQRGSHLVMFNVTTNRQLVIPIHNKTMKKGTLSAILRQGDISLQELIDFI